MITRAVAASYALLARAAEEMHAFGDTPALPLSFDTSDWELVGYLTAANALFGAQALGLGDRCYYGFLARSRSEPGKFAAVVRGTETNVEWLEDAEALLVHAGVPGLVSHGFWSIYSSMQYLGTRAAQAIARAEGIESLVVIGHSLGAALAAYLMAEIKANAPSFHVEGALFACPRPGDANFAHYVDALVGRDNYAVFNHSRDIVPRLPFGLPFGLGFQPLPNVIWLTPAMSTAKVRDGVQCAHSAYTYAALLDPDSVAHGNECVL